MSYESTLEAAGATVHAFKEFGSYQGDWWAKVTYKGVTGWVTGSFGSCSGCDAFESEFDWTCDEKSPQYQKKLAEFGERYLGDIKTQESAVKDASQNLEWDFEAQEMVDFINKNTGEEK